MEIALKKININSSFLATVNQKHTNKVQIINHANYFKKMEADAISEMISISQVNHS